MTLTLTLIVLACGLALAGFANFMSRRPPPPGQVRLMPYTGLQFVGLLVVILMLAHLVSLLTGTPLEGRSAR
ncbi:MAG: hypothetical protein QF797_13400 [Alphaproteobacteria bacterium]|jgi:hypothetical protein|nr:hypothetical protein [Rhodospirillaceae bacterium]MDP6406193.1 hypothetical protein [Alphaproteobacteria bacterium]MDP6621103.1 hypothetical protein [Alphaproteobacteria bacterium]|tara:strand:- start:599 stop:814 length:216 start_codon:yes stop_codon:yes gene_type:complete